MRNFGGMQASGGDSIQDLRRIGIGQRPIFLMWLSRLLKPYLGRTVLHLNAGQGGLAALLSAQRDYTVYAESNDEKEQLRHIGTAKFTVKQGAFLATNQHLKEVRYDTILWPCSMRQILEQAERLHEATQLLAPYGRMLVLLFPEIDDVLGCRGEKEISHQETEFDSLIQSACLQLRQCVFLNRLGYHSLLASLRCWQLAKNCGWYQNMLDRIQFRGDLSHCDARSPAVHRLLVLVHQPQMIQFHV